MQAASLLPAQNRARTGAGREGATFREVYAGRTAPVPPMSDDCVYTCYVFLDSHHPMFPSFTPTL